MIKKGLTDNRKYKIIKLKNNLRALLIQDDEADTSSASIAVRVGAFSDSIPGIAHFCEHMLFMGTKKYPLTNDFSEFLNKNNGYANAYTGIDETVYYYESSNPSFVEALDRFSQFFVSPLFELSAVEMELKNIESENQKNLQSDFWRQMQLERSESNEGSINKIFATGNYKTINPNNDIKEPVEILRKFFNDNYHASRMSLVIDSPVSIEKMEAIVLEKFSDVPTGVGSELDYSENSIPPYDKRNLSRYYTVESITNVNKLNFNWYLDSSGKYYKELPLNYLSILFGHEGKNTLCSSLLKDGLATNLSAGHSNVSNVFSMFSIIIYLTDKGFKERDLVISRVLKYVKLIQSLGVNKRFYDENKIIRKNMFDYKNKEKPSNYTAQLSGIMTPKTKDEDVLTSELLFDVYDEELIKKYLDSMTMNSLNIYLGTKDETLLKDLSKTEKWYGTKFDHTSFSDSLVKEIESFDPKKDEVCSHPTGYPEENKFLPKSLDLIFGNNEAEKENSRIPKLVQKSENCEIWYKPDYVFNRPKAVVICQVYLDKSLFSYAEYESIAYVWNLVCGSKLKDIQYLAEEAECILSLSFNDEGLHLRMSGFNDSMKSALKEFISAFKEIKVEGNEDVIKIYIEKQIKEMQNFYLKEPFSIAKGYMDYLQNEPSAPANEKLVKLVKLIENGILNDNKFKEFVATFLNKIKFSWLIQGNLSEQDAIDINTICNSIISHEALDSTQVQSFRIVDQEVNTNYSYILNAVNPNETNSAIYSSFSCGRILSIRESVVLALINSIIKEEFFNSIRTRQGIGYIVHASSTESRKIASLTFLAQSNSKSPEYIWQKINEFISEQEKAIMNIDDENFTHHVNSKISEYSNKYLSLGEETKSNFIQIQKKDLVFNMKERKLEEIKTVSKDEVKAMYKKLFKDECRRLDVMIISENRKEENEKLVKEFYKENSNGFIKGTNIKRYFVDNIQDYKRRNRLHPDYYLDELSIPKL